MKNSPILTVTVSLVMTLSCATHSARARSETGPPKPAAVASTPASPNPVKPAAPASPIDAQSALRAAREKLIDPKNVQTIKARIVERVSIAGRRLRLEGTYLQGSELKLKLQFKTVSDTTPGTTGGSFLEICDGTILWARYEVGKQSRITRRDVREMLKASKSTADSNLLALELGLGGLPALLASLEQSMKFDSLSLQEISGRKFVVISGAWNDAALQKIKKTPGKSGLPDHVPDGVRIYFEPELLFPRRITFLKEDAAEPLAELDFLDVVINAPIDEHEFDFVPPEHLRTVDVTNQYLEQLKAAPQK